MRSFLLSVALGVLSISTSAFAGSQCRSTGLFTSTNYLYCDGSTKPAAGPFESATACMVWGSFNNPCKSSPAPLEEASARVKSCEELRECANTVCRKFFMNGDDGTSFNNCVRNQCGAAEADAERCASK